MNSSFPKSVVVDSGFWIALFDKRDQYHEQAARQENLLTTVNILIPWPSLYEVVNTRFCKSPISIRLFEGYLRRPHFLKIDDTAYRDKALEESFRLSRNSKRSIGLVDMVIRFLLDDGNVRKHGLLTFNPRDFVDVCRNRSIEILTV